MPVSATSLNRMRSRPQWAEIFLAVEKPDTCWVGRVNGSPARGATTIPYDGGVESFPIERHFTLWVGSTYGNNDIGVLRYKSGAGDGSGNLNVAQNDIPWEDDYYLTIKQQVRPDAVLPSLDGSKEDGDVNYTDENDHYHPLGRIGPPAAGYLSGGNLSVNFWQESVAIADGASIASHAWTLSGGTPSSFTAGGTSDSPNTATYSSTGQHWVKYQVTDDNGKSHNRYSKVYIFDDNVPAITDFEITNLSGNRDNGAWRATITVYEDCDTSDFPELSQVVIFVKARWDGTQADVGYGWKHRENILFVGYIVKDSVFKDAESSYVTFEIAGICEIMKYLTCWGAALKAATSPTAWHELKGMTCNLASFHIFTEHTTIDHIADIYLNLQNITLQYCDFGESNPYDQIKTQVGEAARAILASNKFGQIYLEPNVQLLKTSDRGSIDKMFTLTSDDWRDQLNLAEERNIYEVCQVDFTGFTYDLIQYATLSPGRQWSTGKVQKVTGVRVDDQDEANTYGGLFAAWYNSEWKNVSIPLAGFWPVFDIAPQRYLGITLEAGDTKRGLVWTDINHIPTNVTFTINADGGYILTDIICEQEASGRSGVTNPIPEEPDMPDPPPPPPPPPPPDEPTILEEPDIVYVRIGNNEIYRTENWTDDTPIWVEVSSPDLTGYTIYQLAIDQTSRYIYATCAEGLYRASVDSASPSWVQIVDYAGTLPTNIAEICPKAINITVNGYVGLIARTPNECSTCAYYGRPALVVVDPVGTARGLLIGACDASSCCPYHTASFFAHPSTRGRYPWHEYNVMADNFVLGIPAVCVKSALGTYRHHTVYAHHDATAATYSNEGEQNTGINSTGWSPHTSVDLGSDNLMCVEEKTQKVYSYTRNSETFTDITPGNFDYSTVKGFDRDAALAYPVLTDKDRLYGDTNLAELQDRASIGGGLYGNFGHCSCYYDNSDQLFLAVTTVDGIGVILWTKDGASTWETKQAAMGDRNYQEVRAVWTEAPE